MFCYSGSVICREEGPDVVAVSVEMCLGVVSCMAVAVGDYVDSSHRVWVWFSGCGSYVLGCSGWLVLFKSYWSY